MTNPHGSFIWYELLTGDPDAAAAFYGDVIGWTARGFDQDGVDYRMFAAADGDVAGHMKLPDGAAGSGMRPGWLGYIGVDDVDASVTAITDGGGAVHMPAMDMDGVGRMALVADPQGAPFYVMRGASDQDSRSFAPGKTGHCSWNELSTSDQDGALDFYTGRFDWQKGEAMPMGEMGDYRFVNHGDAMIGGVMPRQDPEMPPAWLYYFQVGDIDAAQGRLEGAGGRLIVAPMEVPGGEYALVASDPQGAAFGLVGPRLQEQAQ